MVMRKQASKGLKGLQKFNQFIIWINCHSFTRPGTVVPMPDMSPRTWGHSAFGEHAHEITNHPRQTGWPVTIW